MNKKGTAKSIILGAVLSFSLVISACDQRNEQPEKSAPAVKKTAETTRPTPERSVSRDNRYQRYGLQPRKAKYYRKIDN